MIQVLMPVKNEASRWLVNSLTWLYHRDLPVLICDDGSEDDTIEIARSFPNVDIVERPPEVPTFLEHEGRFRQWCWDNLERVGVGPGDWVLAIDADEFPVLTEPSKSHTCETLFLKDELLSTLACCVAFNVAEVWAFDPVDGRALVRKDGFWAQNCQRRMTEWREGMKYPNKKMASGALPDCHYHGTYYTTDMSILHYGYALDRDKLAKSERYLTHADGHNPVHIASILGRPTLDRWPFETPVSSSV